MDESVLRECWWGVSCGSTWTVLGASNALALRCRRGSLAVGGGSLGAGRVLLERGLLDREAMEWLENMLGYASTLWNPTRCRTTWQRSASAATPAAEPHSTSGATCAATNSEPRVAPSADPR